MTLMGFMSPPPADLVQRYPTTTDVVLHTIGSRLGDHLDSPVRELAWKQLTQNPTQGFVDTSGMLSTLRLPDTDQVRSFLRRSLEASRWATLRWVGTWLCSPVDASIAARVFSDDAAVRSQTVRRIAGRRRHRQQYTTGGRRSRAPRPCTLRPSPGARAGDCERRHTIASRGGVKLVSHAPASRGTVEEAARSNPLSLVTARSHSSPSAQYWMEKAVPNGTGLLTRAADPTNLILLLSLRQPRHLPRRFQRQPLRAHLQHRPLQLLQHSGAAYPSRASFPR
jgi:hypothetical protein